MDQFTTQHSLARLKILVADDNALLRRGLKEMLSLWGIGQVVTAADGMEAKAVLTRESIDLVVADWIMAPLDGAGLLYWIRYAPDSPHRDLPVIVLTAQADVPTVRAIWDAGADAVLAKPVSATVIARRIEAVLRRSGRAESAVAGNGRPRQPCSAAPDHGAERRAALADGRRMRLLAALDRLGAMLDRGFDGGLGGGLDRADAGGPNTAALRVVAADLLHVADGEPAMEDIARSLARCVTKVDPHVPSFLGTLRAHHAALRWLAVRDGESAAAADASLATCLAASVDSLVEDHPLAGGDTGEKFKALSPPHRTRPA